MQPHQIDDQSIREELKNDSQSITSAAKNRVHNEIDSRKDDGVSLIQEVSSALKKTASELGDSAPNWLKSAVEQGAEQITKFANTLEQKDSRQLASGVRTFAQRSPGTFLTACAAAGFAASRIFKAGEPDTQSYQSNNDSHIDDLSLPTTGYTAPSYQSTQA